MSKVLGENDAGEISGSSFYIIIKSCKSIRIFEREKKKVLYTF